MRIRLMTLIITALLIAAGGPAVRADDTEQKKASQPTLDDIKKLAGQWVAVGEDGKPTDQVISDIRVTAGGSAVHETIFPGTDHEMVTLYYQDGDDLVLTHYCVLGNQPHMKAEATGDPNKLVFTCTNISKDGEAHMHEGTLVIKGENRMQSEWRMFEKGENKHTAGFDLVRRKAN